ncbi:MAG: hypothetical protein XU15_C0008G0008 [candidate division NC10 bacterium CSP1-5]|nr:MAG: hypothetical protein XU15_C0008G0008 [candidate division NC10 bacterium CSP1-5]
MNWYGGLRSKLKRSTLIWVVPLVGAAIMALVITVNWGTTTYRKAEPVANCRQIRLGMTRVEVLKIMPEPVGRISYKKNRREKEKLIFPSREDAATPPQLVIDGKTGRVEEVVCDENYRLTQKQS